MSSDTSGVGGKIFRFLTRALGGPSAVARHIVVATLSVSKALLTLNKAGLVSDIERAKESLLQKSEAEADADVAEARKKLAEAADAVNRANLHKRRDAIARAEKELAAAKAAKTNAEADAIRKDAESRRIKAIAESQSTLIEAISKLRQDGGEFLIDKEDLENIIRIGLSPRLPAPETAATTRPDESLPD